MLRNVPANKQTWRLIPTNYLETKFGSGGDAGGLFNLTVRGADDVDSRELHNMRSFTNFFRFSLFFWNLLNGEASAKGFALSGSRHDQISKSNHRKLREHVRWSNDSDWLAFEWTRTNFRGGRLDKNRKKASQCESWKSICHSLHYEPALDYASLDFQPQITRCANATKKLFLMKRRFSVRTRARS